MVQRHLREPSPKVGGLNKWLIGTALGGAVVVAVVMLGQSEAPPLMPEAAKHETPVASSGASMAHDLPSDYRHLFQPEPAVVRVEATPETAPVVATAPARPVRPPRAPVARCVRPPTTYGPGNLHQASVDAMAYRDCLAQRAYTIAMGDYAWEHGGGAGAAMAGNGGGSGFSPSFSGSQARTASAGGATYTPTAQANSGASSGVQQASAGSGARDRHEDFQARGAQNSTLFHAHEAEELPIDDCVIVAGSKIPAVLLNGINTGAAGSVAAQVSYDVYDTARVCALPAIPAGSRLVGRYDHITGYGQNRVAITWEALTLPDHTTISLAGLSGTDASGTAGVKGDVNNHNAAFFGAVLLGSLVEAAPAIAGLKANVSFGGVAGDTASAGQQIIERELKRQPTITVPAGTEVAVDVVKHLVMGAQ